MRIPLLLLSALLVAACGSKPDKGKASTSKWTQPPGPNRLIKMSDQEACEAFFVKLGKCADEVEAEAVKVEPRRARGLAAEIRHNAKKRTTVCKKQASILRKQKHSPYVCVPWAKCSQFAKCMTVVTKASLQETKRRLKNEAHDHRRKMLEDLKRRKNAP